MLLGRAGRGSAGNGPGEGRRVSCERLRGISGGGGSREEANGDGVEREEEEDDESRARRSDRAEGWRDKDEGRVLEDHVDTGMEGGVHREEPRVRDWVVCQGGVVDEKRSELKGLFFSCASPWAPFSPFV